MSFEEESRRNMAEMNRHMQVTVFAGIAFIIVLFVGQISLWAKSFSGEEEIFEEPYSEVSITQQNFIEKEGSKLLVFSANFRKNGDCQKLLFNTAAWDGSEMIYPGFADLDGRDDDENRPAGLHTLRTSIPIDPNVKWVEVRTLHRCTGSLGTQRDLGRIFWRFQVAETLGP